MTAVIHSPIYLMHAHSDIAGLFSKLADDTKQYQEFPHLRTLEAASARWSLLQEIHRAMWPAMPPPSSSR